MEITSKSYLSLLSTPKGDGSYNVYDDIREKLVERGIPREEICFIHEADTEAKKISLFQKMRSGEARVLIGSSAKCGAGMNIQRKLVALHHIDVPWRPSDIQQREGRIIRQGNENERVRVFRYVTKGTFDAYMWQILEQKQKFIGQIMTSKSPVRTADDIDESALSYAEVKALASGNPAIKEKMQLDNDVSRLKLVKQNFMSQRYRLQDDININLPNRITELKNLITKMKVDEETAKAIPNAVDTDGKPLTDITIFGKHFTGWKEAGTAIYAACTGLKELSTGGEIGTFGGFKLIASFDSFNSQFEVSIVGAASRKVKIGKDGTTNVRHLHDAIRGIPDRIENQKRTLSMVEQQLENSKAEVERPFPQEAELNEKLARLSVLNRELNVDGKEQGRTNDVLADSDEERPPKPSIRSRLRQAKAVPQRPSGLEQHKKKEHSI